MRGALPALEEGREGVGREARTPGTQEVPWSAADYAGDEEGACGRDAGTLCAGREES